STTSCGRPGGSPVQPSGRRSTNSFSPAAIELTVTLRLSARRTPVPSGPRRPDIARGGERDTVDRNDHPLLECDDQNAVVEPHFGVGFLGKREHEPRIAIL